jgi:hypothetical protein
MGYSLQDRLQVSLFFSGKEFPLSGVNTLHVLQMDMSVRIGLPTLYIELTDQADILTKINLVHDNTPISVVLTPYGATQSSTYNFLSCAWQSFKATTGTVYKINGYLAYPKYWMGTANTGIQGTSDTVLQQIASTCGLTYSNASTSDPQLWLPQNRTYATYVKRTVERGYASTSSCMLSGVDFTGQLMYRDFNTWPNPITNVVIGELVSGSVTAMDYVPTNHSGFNNAVSGYNSVRVAQSAVNTLQTSSTNLSFTPNSVSPLYSLDTKNTVQRGYVMYSPIDFGNTHPNYEQAVYQNMRYKNLLNAGVEILAITPTNLNLFDVFNFVVRNPEGQDLNQAWSGNYRVTSKFLRIEGITYTEMIEAFRHGTNTPQYVPSGG